MARYLHTFPMVPRKRHQYTKLFNREDKAIMEYKRNMAFRSFVNDWNNNVPEMMGWSITQFYDAYQKGNVQLTLSF